LVNDLLGNFSALPECVCGAGSVRWCFPFPRVDDGRTSRNTRGLFHKMCV